MKPSTQKKLFAGFIIFTFIMSSIAFVFTLFTGGGLPNQQEFKPLANFVVDGPINSSTENVYIQAGFTSLRLYYNNDALLGFADQLPQMTSTNAGQQQLIVQKIPSNETYAKILSLQGAEEITNVTIKNLTEVLCRLLTVKPLECAVLNFTK